MPEDGIIALDNGVYKIWFARNYKAYSANTVLLDNALATMGAGFPSAMGAKMVYPERKVLAICGDGGFMMNSQEMETAVRLNLNLVVLILRDNAYGMIKWKQAGMGFKDFGLDYGNPDFVKYAQAYGANGHRVEKADQFSEILQTCLEAQGVHLIEVPVDYSENEQVLIAELDAKTCIIVITFSQYGASNDRQTHSPVPIRWPCDLRPCLYNSSRGRTGSCDGSPFSSSL